MFNFNAEKYLEIMDYNYNLKNEINELVDKICKDGYDNLFLVGIGGTIAYMKQYASILKSKSSIEVHVENAAEFQLLDNNRFTDRSVVIVSSESGTTSEIVQVLKYVKSKGARTIGFVCKDNTPIGDEVDNLIVYKGCSETFFDHTNMVKLLMTTRFMYNAGDFPEYDKFVSQLESFNKTLVYVREEFDADAKEFADKYGKEDYHMLIGSGNLWGGVYSMAMCILEEMQWISTQSISAPEFFHGALEMLTADTSIMIFKGEDATRPLSDRVENFAEKISNKVSVFDTKKYKFENIDDEFRDILSPLVTGAFFERIAKYLESVRKHDLSIRRYYRVMKY